VLTHLKNKRRIDCAIDEDAIPSSIAALGVTASAGAQIISIVATKAVREACECLRWWRRSGVVSGKVAVVPIASRVQIEAWIVATLLGDLGEDVE
jgi:hypothetical protein